MSDDIVTRLREAGECPTPLRAYLARAVVLRAADEIERLRAVVEAWKTYSSRAERDIAELREERDAARKKFCEMCASVGGVYRRVGGENVECRTAEEIADICGWDCYEVKP